MLPLSGVSPQPGLGLLLLLLPPGWMVAWGCRWLAEEGDAAPCPLSG